MKKFHIILTDPIYFRYALFILLTMNFLTFLFIPNPTEFYLAYILATIFLGMGYYNKPIFLLVTFTTIIVLLRIYTMPEADELTMLEFIIHVASYNTIMLISVGLMANYQKNKHDYFEMIKTLTRVLDSKDEYTYNHSENVARYSTLIAEEMQLSKKQCEHIRIGALLHDVGKVGIADTIINKPGRLTDEEYDIIKTHPLIGHDILKYISSFKDYGILDIILCHHERFDGSGYPQGLDGKDIPLGAKIVAVADAFDAMTSNRVYRDKLDPTYVINEISRNRGKQFDPEVVDSFLTIIRKEENFQKYV